MYAIGHFALGYLTGKGTAAALKTNLNLPLLLAVSVLPDIDLLLGIADPTLFMHRGPTHSLITFTVVLMPFLFLYGKRALPYYVAALSHSLMGDLFTGGIEAFWPLTQDWYGTIWIPIGSLADAVAELSLFAVATTVMFKLGDLQALLKPKNHNLWLIIGFGALLGPILETRPGLETNLPLLLLGPSLFWLALFAYSILLDFKTSRAASLEPQANTENPP